MIRLHKVKLLFLAKIIVALTSIIHIDSTNAIKSTQ